MFHLITHMDTYTHDRDSLDKGSNPLSSLYLFNAKHSLEKYIHAPAGIQTPIPGSERSQVYALNIFTLMFSLARQRSMFSRFTKFPIKYRNLIPSFLVHFTTVSNCFFDDWHVMSWKSLDSGYDLLGALFRHLPGSSKKTTKYNLTCRLKFWCVAAAKKNLLGICHLCQFLFVFTCDDKDLVGGPHAELVFLKTCAI